jgi:hypothetical protein
MNAEDFKKLETKLGHPPTAKEVREAKPRFKTANVQFKDPSYNYRTSVNGELSDEEIVQYFKGKTFNLGNVQDDLHICIECTVEPSNL